ncbi:MAG: FAD-dependent oxidoreductase, partial [Pseudomonadota bacterium]
MPETLTPDLCVIGAGSGGLSVAAGAVQMGASVVLIEGHKMGGDCLNYGCVPSKALIAAGKAAQAQRTSAPFGVTPVDPQVDYAAAMDHVRSVIAGIEPHDSVERFEGLGVHVIQGWAEFTGPKEVTAAGVTVRPRRFVIATGSHPVAPPIPGLADVDYLTNETLWDNRELPSHLIVIGGGPIGLEMAQAHRRLGAEVTVLEAFKALGKDDPEAAAVVLQKLRGDGIDLREGVKIENVTQAEGSVSVALDGGETLTGSHLLVAAGRAPNIDRLNLDAAGIDHDKRGIKVNKGLRSVSNSKVYAIGDVAGGLQFTHMAGYQAGLIIRSALFRLPVTNRTDLIPWVTYTDPELAQVGLTEAAAREEHGNDVEVARFDYAENDRARAELKTDGFAKAIIGRRGKILGATIVGASAG